MSHLRSTMGAPLNDSEETHITFTWSLLVDGIRGFDKPTPTEMLEAAAEIIGRAHKLQRVIHDCWSAANRRCYPENAARKRSAIHSAAADLRALGIAPTELLEALKSMDPVAEVIELVNREEPTSE